MKKNTNNSLFGTRNSIPNGSQKSKELLAMLKTSGPTKLQEIEVELNLTREQVLVITHSLELSKEVKVRRKNGQVTFDLTGK